MPLHTTSRRTTTTGTCWRCQATDSCAPLRHCARGSCSQSDRPVGACTLFAAHSHIPTPPPKPLLPSFFPLPHTMRVAHGPAAAPAALSEAGSAGLPDPGTVSVAWRWELQLGGAAAAVPAGWGASPAVVSCCRSTATSLTCTRAFAVFEGGHACGLVRRCAQRPQAAPIAQLPSAIGWCRKRISPPPWGVVFFLHLRAALAMAADCCPSPGAHAQTSRPLDEPHLACQLPLSFPPQMLHHAHTSNTRRPFP